MTLSERFNREACAGQLAFGEGAMFHTSLASAIFDPEVLGSQHAV